MQNALDLPFARLATAPDSSFGSFCTYARTDPFWLSFPLFAKKSLLPQWLRRGRVFGSVELPDEGSGSRRRYRLWMARRTQDVLELEGTAEQAAQWRRLQRGWYLGSESFGQRLMDWADGIVAGRKRASYRREGLRAHDEKEAGRLLSAGLDRLGMKIENVHPLKKNDLRKQALVWLIKTHTVVGDEWIAERLQMGHRSNVSRAVTAFRAPSDRARQQLRKLLHICTD